MIKHASELKRRLLKVLGAALFVVAFGTVGHKLLSPGQGARWLDSLYQTVIVVSTLGIEKRVDLGGSPPALGFTIALILLGVTVAAYALTTMTAFVVEGQLLDLIGRQRMEREISRLRNHYVVCGASLIGMHVAHELKSTARPFVVIDLDEEKLRELSARNPFPFVVGDATEETVLQSAGLDKAAGLLATLPSDRDNLFLVITARQLNPGLRIITRGVDFSSQAKLARAGADRVIYPNFIGAMRMTSEMVRPAVVGFLDQMLRESLTSPVRFEDVAVGPQSPVAGQTLSGSGIHERTGLLVIACQKAEGGFLYNPPPSTVITPGMALIVLGETGQIAGLRQLVGAPPVS